MLEVNGNFILGMAAGGGFATICCIVATAYDDWVRNKRAKK